MGITCKGICHKYKAKWGANQFRYASGQKRCNVREIFAQWGGISFLNSNLSRLENLFTKN